MPSAWRALWQPVRAAPAINKATPATLLNLIRRMLLSGPPRPKSVAFDTPFQALAPTTLNIGGRLGRARRHHKLDQHQDDAHGDGAVSEVENPFEAQAAEVEEVLHRAETDPIDDVVADRPAHHQSDAD